MTDTFGHDPTAQVVTLQQLAVDNIVCPRGDCAVGRGTPCVVASSGYVMQTPHAERSAPIVAAYALGVEQGAREERARHA